MFIKPVSKQWHFLTIHATYFKCTFNSKEKKITLPIDSLTRVVLSSLRTNGTKHVPFSINLNWSILLVLFLSSDFCTNQYFEIMFTRFTKFCFYTNNGVTASKRDVLCFSHIFFAPQNNTFVVSFSRFTFLFRFP